MTDDPATPPPLSTAVTPDRTPTAMPTAHSSNDNFPGPVTPSQWPAEPMQKHVNFAYTKACHVWWHYLDRYLSSEPGEICIPSKPLREATEFVILALQHALSRGPTVKIADGLAIAAFYEVLRDRTGGHFENFSVFREPHGSGQDNRPVALPPAPAPTHIAGWNKAHRLAEARWLEFLPRGLPEEEYHAYRFNELRERVYREATAALTPLLPPAEAADVAWSATTGAIYGAVCAMEYEDLE